MRPKNCTVLFLQYFYQSYVYSDNFRHTYTTINLLSPAFFAFFIKSKTGNQLKFQQYSALAHCSHTVYKLLCREMSDVFIASKLWLSNIPDFNDVEYRIWAVLREWDYQQPVRDVDELRRCLIDIWSSIQQTVIDQMIDQWRFRLRAWVRAGGRQFEHLI